MTTELSSLWLDDVGDEREYERFRKKYFKAPGAFAYDCIDWEAGQRPTPYQVEVLDALVTEKRVSVRGCHGLGKTALSSLALLWFCLTRDGDDWKAPTTASAWRQLTKFLWPEFHKWSRKVKWDLVGRGPFKRNNELMTMSLRLKTGEAFALASNDAFLIEGAHADHVLYVFDESKAIPDPTWDAAEGAMVSDNAMWLCISTPGPPEGRFYNIQSRKPGYEDWWARHVKLQEAINAGRVDADWAEARRRQWGEKSPIFQNRVLGEFAEMDTDSVIPLSWIEAANERWESWREITADEDQQAPNTIGIDVARMGSDQTVFALRAGKVITHLEKYAKEDTMTVTGRAVPYLRKYPGIEAIVDVIGLGAGVYDRLGEQFPDRAFPFVASEKTDFTDRADTWRFVDKRSAAWWHLRELLDPANDEMIALPPDDELIGDLTSPQWRVMSDGRIRVEAKDQIKTRIGRSTDTGDAVVQAFWEETAGGMEFA